MAGWLLTLLAATVGANEPEAPVMMAAPAPDLAGIEAQVVAIRGLEAKAPLPTRVLTPDEMTAVVKSIMERDYSEEEAAEDARFMRALGLVDAGFDLRAVLSDVLGAAVGGLYDPHDGQLYVLDSSSLSQYGEEMAGLSGVGGDMVVAHEMVHALQDQHFDIGTTIESFDQGDAEGAFQALVEGDATFAMVIQAIEATMAIRGGEAPGGSIDGILAFGMAALRQQASAADPGELGPSGGMEIDAPVWMKRQLVAPYTWGALFCWGLYQHGGWEAIDAAFADPPESTEQILHPERYLDRDHPTRVTLPALSLGEGWGDPSIDVVGELGIDLLAGHHVPDGDNAAVAAGWGGDSLAVYAREDGALAAIWALDWDSEDDAWQFHDFATAWLGRTSPGRRVVGKASLSVWSDAERASLVETRDGRTLVMVGIPRALARTLPKTAWKGITFEEQVDLTP